MTINNFYIFTFIKPDKIKVFKNISYLYTPNGNKLRVRTGHALSQQTTDYIGNMIYENDTLSFIQTPEGRVVVESSKQKVVSEDTTAQKLNNLKTNKLNNSITFNYFLTDHLGNTRTIIDENSTILETNTYYLHIPVILTPLCGDIDPLIEFG